MTGVLVCVIYFSFLLGYFIFTVAKWFKKRAADIEARSSSGDEMVVNPEDEQN